MLMNVPMAIFFLNLINWLINLFIYYLFIYFWLRWVFIAACGLFSSCVERGLLFVVVRELLIAVASLCCWALALGTWASAVVVRGLIAPRRVESSRTRAWSRVPCVGRRIFNHCTTREVPHSNLFISEFYL